MKKLVAALPTLLLLFAAGSTSLAVAQERDIKVRKDRADTKEAGGWIYNDLQAGIAKARAGNKPLMVVLRCVL